MCVCVCVSVLASGVNPSNRVFVLQPETSACSSGSDRVKSKQTRATTKSTEQGHPEKSGVGWFHLGRQPPQRQCKARFMAVGHEGRALQSGLLRHRQPALPCIPCWVLSFGKVPLNNASSFGFTRIFSQTQPHRAR